MNTNIRVKFRKYGCLKFIGHLDVMRYFQKAIRRADIAVCYSEGFSPHMIMSFAAPLGVGLTSDGEYMDISVKSAPSSAEAVKRNAIPASGATRWTAVRTSRTTMTQAAPMRPVDAGRRP